MTDIKTISVFKCKNSPDDICAICHENLNLEQTLEIPECKHIFHSNCLIQWFRTGEVRCPYCNSTCKNDEYSNWREKKYKYKIITAYCRRKDADKEVVKKVESIRKLNNKLNEIRKEIQNIKTETGEYKVLQKKISSLGNKKWTLKRKIRDKKQELLYSVNVMPFVINKNK